MFESAHQLHPHDCLQADMRSNCEAAAESRGYQMTISHRQAAGSIRSLAAVAGNSHLNRVLIFCSVVFSKTGWYGVMGGDGLLKARAAAA
jgi:hypothetical protein